MGKKKKQKEQARRNWFFLIGALIASVVGLSLAFLAGKNFDQDYPDDSPDDNPDDNPENENKT
jgi:hypothetical protein